MFAARGKPVREGVCQRIFMMSLGWVDGHSGGFVEYYEIFVFIYYIDRKIDRKNIRGNGFVREKERQGVSDLKRCVQPGRCSVQADLLRVLFELDEDAAGISGIAEEGADGVGFVFICNGV